MAPLVRLRFCLLSSLAQFIEQPRVPHGDDRLVGKCGMSSWGREFGHGGYAWLSFEFWMRIVGVGQVID